MVVGRLHLIEQLVRLRWQHLQHLLIHCQFACNVTEARCRSSTRHHITLHSFTNQHSCPTSMSLDITKKSWTNFWRYDPWAFDFYSTILLYHLHSQTMLDHLMDHTCRNWSTYTDNLQQEKQAIRAYRTEVLNTEYPYLVTVGHWGLKVHQLLLQSRYPSQDRVVGTCWQRSSRPHCQLWL